MTRAGQRFSRAGGFSLLELLIALTILAIALVPVAYFYSKSLQMVEEASIRTRALMLAQERMTEIRQMPYDRIRTNIAPSAEELKLYASTGVIDTDAADWFGYDYEANGDWAVMFCYPLPLDYNPYQPQTQGYNNAPGANHYAPTNPIGGLGDPHVNFNNGTPFELDYEYEPIGFYTQRISLRNRSLAGTDRADIRMADRRTLTAVEPSLVGGTDHFRTGVEQQVDNYAVYGRRTIILDVLPSPQDTENHTDPDGNGIEGDLYAADDDRDGGGTAINPYPITKGPDNKFQVVSRFGSRGKLVIVQVFWLPRTADETYIEADELNKIELRTFIATSNEATNLPAGSGGLTNLDFLNISAPN